MKSYFLGHYSFMWWESMLHSNETIALQIVFHLHKPSIQHWNNIRYRQFHHSQPNVLWLWIYGKNTGSTQNHHNHSGTKSINHRWMFCSLQIRRVIVIAIHFDCMPANKSIINQPTCQSYISWSSWRPNWGGGDICTVWEVIKGSGKGNSWEEAPNPVQYFKCNSN